MTQGSRIRSVRILFFERYARTLTYSILAYVNKNRIREWQCLRANTKLIDKICDTCVMKNQALAGNLNLSKAAKMRKRRLTTLIQRQRLNKINTANL